jgi:hypothetical protein
MRLIQLESLYLFFLFQFNAAEQFLQVRVHAGKIANSVYGTC